MGAIAWLRVWQLQLQSPDSARLHFLPQRRPGAIQEGNGRFETPPFAELGNAMELSTEMALYDLM
jgi:hypothetical protein